MQSFESESSSAGANNARYAILPLLPLLSRNNEPRLGRSGFPKLAKLESEHRDCDLESVTSSPGCDCRLDGHAEESTKNTRFARFNRLFCPCNREERPAFLAEEEASKVGATEREREREREREIRLVSRQGRPRG